MKIPTVLLFALLFCYAYARIPSSTMKSETNGLKNKLPNKLPTNFEGSSDMNSEKNAMEQIQCLIDTIPKVLPAADDILKFPLNVLFGLPSMLISTVLNNICSMLMAGDMVKPIFTPDIKKMQLQLRTPCKTQSIPMLKADEMWRSPDFDPKKNTVILVTGWTTTANSSFGTIEEVAKAYHCRGDTNFIALDAAHYVRTLYTWSSLNTEEIGRYLAKGLAQLAKVIPLEKIHLVGHSLGAHIVGAAGRHFTYETGKTLPRITGLDPAKPCFNHGETLTGLMRGDAKFVDVIHSNVGVAGVSQPVGDVDFFPDGLAAIQKGCFGIVSSHLRSLYYFAESVYPGNQMNFMGKQCKSLTRLREGHCQNPEEPMGYATPHHLTGTYMLEINGEEPFGTNAPENVIKSTSECGTCEAEKKKKKKWLQYL